MKGLIVESEQILLIKEAMKSYRKIIFASATKQGENTTKILNCYFSS